jgi:hypothetical protein
MTAEGTKFEREPAEGGRSTVDKQLRKQADRRGPEKDAEGQFAKSEADRKNSGMTSASPRVLSGKEDGDATFPTKPREKR